MKSLQQSCNHRKDGRNLAFVPWQCLMSHAGTPAEATCIYKQATEYEQQIQVVRRCHRYYLRNLCDTNRFPDWPLVDHVPFLQVGNHQAKPTLALFCGAILHACRCGDCLGSWHLLCLTGTTTWGGQLPYQKRQVAFTTDQSQSVIVDVMQALLDTWRAELSRRPLDMSEADAAAVLGLPPPAADGAAAFSEDDLKAAYRAAARKYHPDKNPRGVDLTTLWHFENLCGENRKTGHSMTGQCQQAYRICHEGRWTGNWLSDVSRPIPSLMMTDHAAGRDKFVAVGAAYERLRAGAAGRVGTRPSVVLLLLQVCHPLPLHSDGALSPVPGAAHCCLTLTSHPDRSLLTSDAVPGRSAMATSAHKCLSASAARHSNWHECSCVHHVQAQCILFARYPEVLAPFKYAGYPMLLDAVALSEAEEGAHFLGPERAPQLQVVCSCKKCLGHCNKCISQTP